MKALHLNLINFRNYEQQELDFKDGVNIISGDNAQGKTNILEAIYFFAMGKSPRTRRDAELIRHGQNSAKICLDFSDSNRENHLEAEIFRDKRKVISANDIPLRKNSELVRRFNVVYFGPEYLGLVREGPRLRRQNLDILISQIRPGYLSALAEMRKIVDSKNALLRMERPNRTMLDIMDEKLAAVSANIIMYRSVYIDKIAHIAGALQDDISGGSESLELKYICCIGDVTGLDFESITKALSAKISESREREIRLGETIVSPHREDIGFFINGTELTRGTSG